MTRFLLMMLALTSLAAPPPRARAEGLEEAGQIGPAAHTAQDGTRIVCVGDAPAPSILRFAFQAEPAQRFRPEVLHTADLQPRRQRAPAGRQGQARTQPAPQLVYLPCING